MIKLKNILFESIIGKKIKCDNCNWNWDITAGGDDLFLCHKCGHDNAPPYASGITQEFGPFKTKAAAKRKMGTFAPGTTYRDVDENFADGKKKGKSRPGRVKRSGASCKGSVTDLRVKAKKYSGTEKGKMYHWCANMKTGKKK